jgi:hypothetical protein
LIRIGVSNQCTRGYFNHKVLTVFPGPLLALSGGAILGFKTLVKLKLIKRSSSGGCFKNDITAFAAITAVRTATGYKFFAPETDTTATTITRLNRNNRFINKFHSA